MRRRLDETIAVLEARDVCTLRSPRWSSVATELPFDLVIRTVLNRVLVVEPRREVLQEFREAWLGVADVDASYDFRSARKRLLVHPPDLLVTNLQLQAHNGLHLLYLATALAERRPRAVLYADQPDRWAIREARALGAFSEPTSRISAAVPSYVAGPLPASDRRHPVIFDRRQVHRGGRRAADRSAPDQWSLAAWPRALNLSET